MKRSIPVLLVLSVFACSKDKGPADPDRDDVNLPEAICDPDARAWGEGTTAFEEATKDWGLDGVEGVRLLAVDFDGDGWTDLVAHKGGAGTDDFGNGGTRVSWLLRNKNGRGFEDVTESSGFRADPTGNDAKIGRPGSVHAFADVDNDGDLDAFVGLNDADDTLPAHSEVLLNNGDGTFDIGPRTDLVSLRVPAAAVFTDHDRNGVVDLWVPSNSVAGSPQQDRLFHGNGKGGFEDVTTEMGLRTEDWRYIADLNDAVSHTNAWSGAACDLNNDGNAELLAASYGRAPNHLWQSDADGTFTNAAIASNYAFDQRNDWSDNESARCWCKHNPSDSGCSGVPDPQYIVCNSASDAFRWNHSYDREAYRLGGNSSATICGDVDNDGHIDLLTTEIVHWDVGSSSDPAELLFNDGKSDLTFDRPGNDTTGLTRDHDRVDWNDGDMTGALFDFDNDGWLDVYVGSSDYPGARGHLWHQTSPRQFERVPLADGIDHTRSHGIAVADFDRDGDLDVVVGHSRMRCDTDCYDTANVRFFENQLAGNFVQLSLEGTDANRSAIGARVTVTADGVTQTQEVGGGHGHYGAQNDLNLHFGLATACEAEVTVRWPDAELTTQSFRVTAGHRFKVVQGSEPQALNQP